MYSSKLAGSLCSDYLLGFNPRSCILYAYWPSGTPDKGYCILNTGDYGTSTNNTFDRTWLSHPLKIVWLLDISQTKRQAKNFNPVTDDLCCPSSQPVMACTLDALHYEPTKNRKPIESLYRVQKVDGYCVSGSALPVRIYSTWYCVYKV